MKINRSLAEGLLVLVTIILFIVAFAVLRSSAWSEGLLFFAGVAAFNLFGQFVIANTWLEGVAQE